MTTSTPTQRFSSQKNTAKWPSAKCIITNSGGHNAALKTYIRILSSYYWPKLWSDTPKLVLNASNERNPQTNHLHYNLFQTQTSSQPDISTNTFCASRTHLRSTRLSQLWRTKRLRLWQNGFVNLASQHKYTLMTGRSLLTNYQMNFSHFLKFNTLKQLWPIPSAMLKLKFSTKPWRNIYLPSSMTPPWTGRIFYLHWCSHKIPAITPPLPWCHSSACLEKNPDFCLSESRHSANSLWRINFRWTIPTFAKNQVPCKKYCRWSKS